MKKWNWDKILNVVLGMLLVWTVYRYFKGQPDVETGIPAPDFSIVDISGKPLTLSDFRGDYVLLDFWASWCGPCRRSHPGLVKLYDSFSDVPFPSEGKFVVISISLDNNAQNWRKAIEKDGLRWSSHALDQYLPAMGGSVASLYDVRQIPSRFLIDDKGMIVRVNPGMRFVRRFLREKMSE